jgi:hypothetical protein
MEGALGIFLFLILDNIHSENFARHCERSEAIHDAKKQEWIASSLRSSQ